MLVYIFVANANSKQKKAEESNADMYIRSRRKQQAKRAKESNAGMYVRSKRKQQAKKSRGKQSKQVCSYQTQTANKAAPDVFVLNDQTSASPLMRASAAMLMVRA